MLGRFLKKVKICLQRLIFHTKLRTFHAIPCPKRRGVRNGRVHGTDQSEVVRDVGRLIRRDVVQAKTLWSKKTTVSGYP